jgi:hypothetical protein
MIDHEIKDLRFMVMFDPTDGKILCLLALDWDETKHLGVTNERAVQTDGMLAFWFTGRQVLMYASKVCGVMSQERHR